MVHQPSGAGAALPAWRRDPSRGRRRWRHVQIGTAWAALFALTAMFLWASTWLQPPRPARLVLLGAGYQDNLAVPHNAYGWQSLLDLARMSSEHGIFSAWGENLLRLPHGPQELLSGSDWTSGLQDVPERAVVLVFALHGAADTQGAFLLTADTDGSGNEKHRLRLDAILDRLARLPSEKHKLLIFDTTQMTANWRLGLLHNDFARQLSALEGRIAAIPNLVVMCASDAGQRSWASDEWRRTAFLHYVIEGLRGASSDLENDGRINAWELHSYVSGNVQGWVQANRAARQTPILLPPGEEGRRRALRIDLAAVRRHYEPPSPHQVAAFHVPPELVQAWNRHDELSRQSPHPSAYAPQTWRLFQDTLLRYEQLQVAGEEDWAARLEARLHELAKRIERARTLEIASFSNTLTMPAAAGYRGRIAEEDINRAASELWSASPQESAKTWLNVRNTLAQDELGRHLLRLRMSEWILQRAAEDPATHLDRAVRLLRTIDDPSRPRPAEAHYAVMLNRDALLEGASSDYSDLLRLAISVRCLAEQAALGVHESGHPYSEFVWSIVRAQVEEADRWRCGGEDLLLASAHEWPEARRRLESARTAYLTVLDSTRQVQRALQVRDYVFSMLPYYSRCLAARLVEDEAGKSRQEEYVHAVVALWRETHRLAEQLDGLSAEGIYHAPQQVGAATASRSLSDQADFVQRSYDDLRNTLQQWWEELSSAELPSMWHEADAALCVPHRDSQLRLKLLSNKCRTSRRLFIETAQRTWGKKPPLQAGTTAQNHLSEREQGVLALAALGRKWFDACPGNRRENFDQVQRRLEVFEVEEHWYRSLALAGEQIGQRWQQLPAVIQSLLSQAQSAQRSEALKLLVRADRLSRQLDAVGAAALDCEAADVCRRLRMQDLLLWQAERTLAERWYSEDPQGEPYFRLAGAQWLDDAQQMDAHVQAVTAARQRYAAAKPLTLEGPTRILLTSQLRSEDVYRLKPGDAGLAGFPVLWVQSAQPLELQFPRLEQRLVCSMAADQPDGLLPCTFTCPAISDAERAASRNATVQRSSLEVRGLFRGQQLTISTPVEIHLQADQVFSSFPLPQRGSVAVRADARLHERFGAARGAVAIVLDCSGSMGPPKGKSFDSTTKYAEATAALRQVLSRLPAGTTVSLWAFGQAEGAQKTVDDPERTIRRILSPTPWDPSNTAQLADLMAKVQYPALEPWNESPILEAMLKAKQDFAADAGFKTLLVLTDGMDNRFEKTHPKQDLAAALRSAFQATGIVVNIVGFKVVQQEAAHARRQFQCVETLDPPGKFVTVDQAATLATALDAALRQRLRYRIDQYDNTPLAGMPSHGFDVSRQGDNDQWFPAGLLPGSYRLRLQTDQDVAAPITINRGDLLLLRLKEAGGRLTVARCDWTAEDFSWKPSAENAQWRMSLLENRRTVEGDLRLLVALERRANAVETMLEQIRPREVWLEVQPEAAAGQNPSLHWYCLPQYPAACWAAELPAWPGSSDGLSMARPTVRLWWNAEQESAPAAILKRGQDFSSLRDLSGRSVRVLDDEIRIDSVCVEEHIVQTKPGERSAQSCLVVRAVFPPGSPLWCRVAGVQSAGQEHRYYRDIGCYTGLFWPVTQDEAEVALTGIGLISLEQFKRDAAQRGCSLQLTDLPAPSPGDLAPRSPWESP